MTTKSTQKMQLIRRHRYVKLSLEHGICYSKRCVSSATKLSWFFETGCLLVAPAVVELYVDQVGLELTKICHPSAGIKADGVFESFTAEVSYI